MGVLRLLALVASLFVANAFAPTAWQPRTATALNSIMDAGSPAATELETMKKSMKERLDKKLADMLMQVENEMPKIDSAAEAAAADGMNQRLDKIEKMLQDMLMQVENEMPKIDSAAEAA